MTLKRALTNLIDNAMCLCPAGASIRIESGHAADEAWITVADNCRGFSAEHRERVFECIYPVRKTRGRAAGGFGLGLVIARWATETNGGRVRARW